MSVENPFPNLFQPARIGTLRLRNRIVIPPHGRMVGDLFGAPAEAARNLAYWQSRARDGAAWVVGINGFIDNIVPRGFRPTGTGWNLQGTFHHPEFQARAARFADAIHDTGACVSVQIIHQGGMPHSPSGRLANYVNNVVPHVMDAAEIAHFVEDYGFAARQIRATGVDGIELHANHEDILQLFISPATNRREDAWGGDRERRLKFVKDVLVAIRAETGSDFTVGLRFNMHELFDGGYDVDEGIEIARSLEATGHIDYVHGVIGNNWGAPSYVQPHQYEPGQWAGWAGAYRRALRLPVIYSGRVDGPVTAERILAAGQADMVGMARAMFADAQVVSQAAAGRPDRIRPCVGTNDCLHGQLVEGLPFGCAVNPDAGRESEPARQPAKTARRIAIVGGGAAGLESAIRLRERGHEVVLWERAAALGGQMRLVAQVAENGAWIRYIEHQSRRLSELGVRLHLGVEATPAAILAERPDVAVVATGARPRGLEVPGAELEFVLQGWDVLAGRAHPGRRVVLVAMEDHMQPLSIASFLADLGCSVEIVYCAPQVAPLVGKYSIGGILAKLSARGASVRVMERVASIAPGRLELRNVYSNHASEITEFDSVVLACGGTAQAELYAPLKAAVPQAFVIGDAYAPRRLWFATRQAWSLAASL